MLTIIHHHYVRILILLTALVFQLGCPIPRHASPQLTSNSSHLVELASWPHEFACVSCSPDGRLVAVRDAIGLWFYDVFAPDIAQQHIPGQFGCPPIFNTNGEQIAVYTDTTVRILDVATGQIIKTLEGHDYGITGIALSPDSTRLASSGRDYRTIIWDTESGEALFTFKQDQVGNIIYPANGYAMAFSPDGSQLVAATRHTVHIWDVQTGQWVAKLSTGTSPESALFSPDGSRLIVSSTVNGKFDLWDTATWQTIATGISLGWRNATAFSSDSQYLALITFDETLDSRIAVEIRDTIDGNTKMTLDQNSTSVVYAVDDMILLVGGDDGSILIWDLDTGKTLTAYQAHDSRISELQMNPDDIHLISTADDAVHLWEIVTTDKTDG